MNIEWLNMLRHFEMEKIMSVLHVDSGASILEIGAGTGYQARLLHDHGFNVRAIDVGSSNYRQWQVYPVEEYDGVHIPAADGEFDIIFSSNVLEHIRHVERFLSFETKRVLKDDGIAIHVVPSATWRFWSIVSHYIDIPARLCRFAKNRMASNSIIKPSDDSANDIQERTTSQRVLSYIFPLRHGERGNTLFEIYFFSRVGWSKLFKTTGWEIVERVSSGIFYTGAGIGGSKLSLSMRVRLALFLGSATHIYILKKCAA